MEYTKVIKVKYGTTLRRFNAFIDQSGQLVLDMNGLRAKVITLFNLLPNNDNDISLTYIDEDGDVVTLVDDEDLHDVMRQNLKFIRINVQLKTEKDGRSFTRSSGSSARMNLPLSEPPLEDSASFTHVVKPLPEPLCEALSKVSADLASKAASSSPVLSEVIKYLSKMGESYLNPVSQSDVGANSNTPNMPCDGASASDVGADSDRPNVPSSSPIDALVTEGTKPAIDGLVMECAKPSGTDVKSNGGGNIGLVTRGVGSITTAAPAPVDLNLPGFAVISGFEMNIVPAVGSNVPAVNKETHKRSDDALVASNDIPAEKSEETKKPLVALSDCPLDGRRGSELEGIFGHKDQKYHGCVASTSNAGFPRPQNADPSLFSHFDGYQNNKYPAVPNFECPFSGLPPTNNPVLPPPGPSHFNKVKRSYKDAVGSRFHKGIQCDGCGILPIAGTRFISKVKADYDLCSTCFSTMGNEADFIRADWPDCSHPFFKPLHNLMQQPKFHSPTQPHIFGGCGARSYQADLSSRFVLDVNVMDGAVMAPLTPFTKTWRMRNNGKGAWPRGTRLIWIGGDKFSEKDSVEVHGDCVPIDQEIEISVDFTAPEFPGRYISYWRMASPSGQTFGQRIWVLIQVDAALKDLLSDSMDGLNLNFPPYSVGLKRTPQIIDVNVEPVVDGDLMEVTEPGKMTNLVDVAEGLNSPINDTFVTGSVGGPSMNDTLVPSCVAGPSSVISPIVDMPNVAPNACYDPQGVIASLNSKKEGRYDPELVVTALTSKEDNKNNDLEESLLKALNEMGFKYDAFNREVLRLHKYDLEQAVDHLCGVGEWDPMLEELQIMGFHDTELNKKLLRKNNGSIKRVVMDLIALQKA